MDSKPLISIVIPTFNKQSTLRKCLNSLKYQSYSNIEVIIIDDCSTDSSCEIANEFCNIDSRFLLKTNKKNIGQYRSRYLGITLLKGQFATFVDADDWMEQDAIQQLVEATIRYNVDLVQLRFHRRFKSFAKKYNEIFNPQLCDRHIGGEEFRTLASFVGMDSFIQPPCWGKLYRSDILKYTHWLEFEHFWGEDQIFNIQYLRNSKSVAFIDYVGYNYRWGGETSSNYKFSALESYKYVHSLKRILGQNEEYINEEIISLLRYHIRQMFTELGWTHEAVVDYIEEELHDSLWAKAGLTSSAEELVKEEHSKINSKPLKYIIKRLLR